MICRNITIIDRLNCRYSFRDLFNVFNDVWHPKINWPSLQRACIVNDDYTCQRFNLLTVKAIYHHHDQKHFLRFSLSICYLCNTFLSYLHFFSGPVSARICRQSCRFSLETPLSVCLEMSVWVFHVALQTDI